MYAVIKAGGKQHRVSVGDVVEVELVHGGDDESLTFQPLLVVDDDGHTHVGKEVAKAQVKAKLAGEKKGDKVKVFKYRPKSGYAKTQGHRQMYTLVEVTDISLPKSRSASSSKKDDAAEAPAPETEASEAPASGAE
jgi:large subunit ribosomal protein L21